jgi:hypothetical protein
LWHSRSFASLLGYPAVGSMWRSVNILSLTYIRAAPLSILWQICVHIVATKPPTPPATHAPSPTIRLSHFLILTHAHHLFMHAC